MSDTRRQTTHASFILVHASPPPVVPDVLHAPRRFHPGHSLLGRWLRRQTGDRRRAEALHLLVLTGLALGLLLLHFLYGALVHELFILPPPAGTYWLGQAVLVGVLFATCVIGFRPALTVTCNADAVRFEQGDRTLTVPYAAVTSVQRITAQRFHRHERRYAATRLFIGVLGDEVLLLRPAGGGPVAVGLAPDDLDTLRRCLDEVAREPARAEGGFVAERAGEREPESTGG